MPEVYKSKKISAAIKNKSPHAHRGRSKKLHKGKHRRRSHEGEHGHNHNPLSAYSYYPEHVKFVAADREEEVVLLLRKHPITNMGWMFTALLMAFAPILLTFFPFVELVPFRFQIFGVVMWYLITTAFVFEEFLSWYFNVYIITDERVFDVDFVNLLYREITDANIDQIQDVTTTVGGALRTVFKFGDVFIQTASGTPQIEFEAVPDPDRVASVLRDLRVEEEIEKMEGRVR